MEIRPGWSYPTIPVLLSVWDGLPAVKVGSNVRAEGADKVRLEGAAGGCGQSPEPKAQSLTGIEPV